MGRPKTSEENLRSVNFTIRLTRAEQKQLEEAASVCGRLPAVLVREKVFSGKFPKPRLPQVDLDTYVALKKIGVNINQLTRLAHASRMNQKLVELLVDLWKQQNRIISLLLAHDSHSEDR